jgi:alkanesulfonate monooxygenase
VLIGGKGARRTPMLAAQFADEFNVPFASLEEAAAQFDRTAAACADIGRDPASLRRSAALVIAVGRDDDEVARRALAIGRSVPELRANGIAGSPEEAADRIGTWRDRTDISRIYLQLLDLADLDHVDLIAAEVVPRLA